MWEKDPKANEKIHITCSQNRKKTCCPPPFVYATKTLHHPPELYKPVLDKGSSVEEIELEEDKSTAEQVLQILINVCVKPGVSVRKKALYLSAFYKLISSQAAGTGTLDLGLRVKEIMLW